MTPDALNQDIRIVEQTASTNADLVADLRAGRERREGFWLVALRQVAGRGRQGRAWQSAPGNFTGSTPVRLDPGDPVTTTLSLVAAIALYEAVSEYLPERTGLRLKWPNDVELDGRKLSGILLEREGNFAVIGIGVNLVSAPRIEGRETGSLAVIGPAPDLRAFAETLADCFAFELERWRRYGAQVIIARWLDLAHPVGTPLAVHDGSGAKGSGTFAGLERDGALRLALPDGTVRIVHAGEIEEGAG